MLCNSSVVISGFNGKTRDVLRERMGFNSAEFKRRTLMCVPFYISHRKSAACLVTFPDQIVNVKFIYEKDNLLKLEDGHRKNEEKF